MRTYEIACLGNHCCQAEPLVLVVLPPTIRIAPLVECRRPAALEHFDRPFGVGEHSALVAPRHCPVLHVTLRRSWPNDAVYGALGCRASRCTWHSSPMDVIDEDPRPGRRDLPQVAQVLALAAGVFEPVDKGEAAAERRSSFCLVLRECQPRIAPHHLKAGTIGAADQLGGGRRPNECVDIERGDAHVRRGRFEEQHRRESRIEPNLAHAWAQLALGAMAGALESVACVVEDEPCLKVRVVQVVRLDDAPTDRLFRAVGVAVDGTAVCKDAKHAVDSIANIGMLQIAGELL